MFFRAFLLLLCMQLFAEPVKTKLNNGLEVIVIPDHRAPTILIQTWYKVGSADESLGITGISHVLEHMMFRGSSKNHSLTVANLGGITNAFTSRDYTAYYEIVPKKFLTDALLLEAKRMRHLDFSTDELQKELMAVVEERHMRVDDTPMGKVMEQFYSTIFTGSPYQQPIIGWQNDITQLQKEEIKDWHKKWYHPNNAIIVIAGDIDPQEAIDQVKMHFGDIRYKKITKKTQRPQFSAGTTQSQIKANVATPNIIIGFHAPSLVSIDESSSWKSYALILLSNILADNGNGLLEINDNLGIINSVQSYYSAFNQHDVLFLIMAQLNSKKSPSIAKKFIFMQLEKIKNNPINDSQLNIVKQEFINQHVFAKDSLNNQATFLGSLAAVNLPTAVDTEIIDHIKAITPQQIQQVAKEYLDQHLVITVLPQE